MDQLEVDRLEVKRKLLENRLQQIEIQSPIDGIVVSRDLERSEGVPVTLGQVLLEVVPLDSMFGELAVPDDEIPHVDAGMSATLRLDAYPDVAWTGSVTSILPRSVTREKDNVFLAEVPLDNRDRTLRPGMKGHARIDAAQNIRWDGSFSTNRGATSSLGWAGEVNSSDIQSVRDPAIARLKLREDLVISPDISGGTRCYAIEDPLRSKFYLVGIPEFTFISLLDGRTSIAGALSSAAQQLGPQALLEHEALAICQWLLDSQLAQTDDSAMASQLCESAEKIAQRRLLGSINPLMIKIPLMNPIACWWRSGLGSPGCSPPGSSPSGWSPVSMPSAWLRWAGIILPFRRP